jgi:hypothetical protein
MYIDQRSVLADLQGGGGRERETQLILPTTENITKG